MLSKTAEYALRLVIALAEADSEEAIPCRELAERAMVPEEYAVQILCNLSRRKVVTGQRGRVGGYRLAKRPDRLTLLEVVNAVQPIERIRSCPLGFGDHGHSLCPLHQCIDDVLAYLEERLAGATVQSLIDLKFNDGLCRRLGSDRSRMPRVVPLGIEGREAASEDSRSRNAAGGKKPRSPKTAGAEKPRSQKNAAPLRGKKSGQRKKKKSGKRSSKTR